MPLNRLLNDAAFGPEEVRVLNQAYDSALRALYLIDRNDPITEIVARKVIELGRKGMTDPAEIANMAVKTLGSRI